MLGPYRDNLDYPRFDDAASWRHPVLRGLAEAVSARASLKAHQSQAPSSPPLEFKRLHELYPHYEWTDVARHPAVVLIP